MKVFRVKCDRCGKEVEYRKARLLTVELQKAQGETLLCMPQAMQQMNTNAYIPTTIDLCNECVKDILNMIPGMEDYANRL